MHEYFEVVLMDDLQQLKLLIPSQKQRLHHNLEASETSTEEVLTVKSALHSCLHCQSKKLKPWGSSHAFPRHQCAEC